MKLAIFETSVSISMEARTNPWYLAPLFKDEACQLMSAANRTKEFAQET